MIIYSEKRLVPTEVNMLVVKGKDGGYFYVHRALYDQAVIIHDLYGEAPEQLFAALTGSQESREDVDTFLAEVPAPLNILGAYLLLVKEPIEDLIDMIGAVHVMSGPCNFRRMLQAPMEVRTSPSFSLSIKEEYQLAWDRFFVNALPYSDDMFFQNNNNRPMNGVDTETESVEEDDGELSNVGEDGVEYDNPLEALLFGSGDDIFDFDDEEDSSDSGDDSSSSETEVTPIVETQPEPEPVPEPVQAEPEPPKKLTGIDALLGGAL